MNSVEFYKLESKIEKINNAAFHTPNSLGVTEAQWAQLTETTKLAHLIFEQIQGDQIATSPQAKLDLFHRVHQKLLNIKTEIRAAKTYYQKFISLFTYLSNEERRFHQFLNRVAASEKEARFDEQKLWIPEELSRLAHYPILLNVLHWLVKTISGIPLPISRSKWNAFIQNREQSNLSKPEGQVREAYFRISDEETLSSSLEGSSRSQSVSSVRDEVKSFAKFMDVLLSPEDRRELAKVGNQLDSIEKISHGFSSLASQEAVLSKATEKMRVADLAYEVQQQIYGLKPGEELILPGGYNSSSGGHALLYIIKRQEDGRFTFTIVNTGEGVGTYSGTFSFLKSLLWDGKYSDYVIENVDPSCLEPSFLIPLISLQIPKQNHSMEKVFDTIITGLLDGDASQIKEGKRHTVQKNGTCTHSCICCWLESSLNPELFHLLDLYMNASGIGQLLTIQNQQPTSHEVSHVQGVIGMRTLSGSQYISELEKIGRERFHRKSEQLESIIKRCQNIYKKALQDSQELENKLRALQDGSALLEKEIVGLKERVVELEMQVDQENQQVQEENKKRGLLKRITQTAINIFIPSSQLAQDFKQVQQRLKTAQEQLAKQQTPAFQSNLQMAIQGVEDEIRGHESGVGILKRQKTYLEQFISIPTKMQKHFNVKDEL